MLNDGLMIIEACESSVYLALLSQHLPFETDGRK
jgi:hypothetical protein